MTTLIKPSSALPGFPSLPIMIYSSTIPKFICRLPIDASVEIERDGLQMHLERSGSLGGDESYDVFFRAEDMLGMDAILVKDMPSDTPYSERNEWDYSTVTIRHKDPFGVVPHFETIFKSEKSYWIRALMKAANELFHIEVKVLLDQTAD